MLRGAFRRRARGSLLFPEKAWVLGAEIVRTKAFVAVILPIRDMFLIWISSMAAQDIAVNSQSVGMTMLHIPALIVGQQRRRRLHSGIAFGYMPCVLHALTRRTRDRA